MGVLVVAVGALVALVGIGCTLVIVVEAFQDESWKGVISLVFPLYLVYFAMASSTTGTMADLLRIAVPQRAGRRRHQSGSRDDVDRVSVISQQFALGQREDGQIAPVG
jgi:hypothetical protein